MDFCSRSLRNRDFNLGRKLKKAENLDILSLIRSEMDSLEFSGNLKWKVVGNFRGLTRLVEGSLMRFRVWKSGVSFYFFCYV